MYLREDELDERVIARILESRSDNLLQRLDHMETAKELLRLKEEADKREQMNDIARSMWKSRLHTYRHNGKKIAV